MTPADYIRTFATTWRHDNDTPRHPDDTPPEPEVLTLTETTTELERLRLYLSHGQRIVGCVNCHRPIVVTRGEAQDDWRCPCCNSSGQPTRAGGVLTPPAEPLDLDAVERVLGSCLCEDKEAHDRDCRAGHDDDCAPGCYSPHGCPRRLVAELRQSRAARAGREAIRERRRAEYAEAGHTADVDPPCWLPGAHGQPICIREHHQVPCAQCPTPTLRRPAHTSPT